MTLPATKAACRHVRPWERRVFCLAALALISCVGLLFLTAGAARAQNAGPQSCVRLAFGML